ncbi:P-loop containing nucleoside triphosphate hydrolases superfamily protein [Prunus dulcis]|uniref:P-loop containing nucleoside triphosphate hydrolases superfamily protein n=1 Tax=Prunus dulcis TaxID=3755 RepID=A0A4Y1RZV2_PRUDU|nr:P-loop containing nucleoside triphosphate hydrolases superfamily protein [Prunus dulcis]
MGGVFTCDVAEWVQYADTGEDFSLEQDSSQLSSPLLRNDLSMNVKDAAEGTLNWSVLGELDSVDSRFSSASLDFEVKQKRRESVYREILLSNDGLRIRSKGLEEAKIKVLSYTPGAWIESVGAVKLRDYDVPKTTTVLLVGPKGSGKSSLVNRISKVFEDDKFASERAQLHVYCYLVPDNSSVGDGTLFLQEYMIPRCSTSFCLYDTRSLCDDSHENIKILQHWMKNGVRHGELVIRNLSTFIRVNLSQWTLRDSDSQSLRTMMMCKARDDGYLSVLKAIESDEDAETRYTQMIASAFDCPYLAFKDDKPLVVVTHGDLLSPVQRARVRVHLGELLGIPPATQVFDIPESSDPVTELAIVDMLRYSLERAEKNLPHKRKVPTMSLLSGMLLLVILGIAINIWCMNYQACIQHGPFPSSQADIRHCPSPQMNLQQGHGSSPQAHVQHGPSPEVHIQHGPPPPSPKAHIQHGPPPLAHIQHDHSSEEHIYHGPLPEAELHNIRTKAQKGREKPGHGPTPQAELQEHRTEPDVWIDWSEIRHLWLDRDVWIDWSKIRHLWLGD